MKADKQKIEDFKIESKAIKAEIKATKKDASKAKKSIKQNTKTLAKTERALGHCYYRERSKPTAEGTGTLKHFCAVISAAEKNLAEFTERKECADLRIASLKADLKQKKKALKQPEIPAVSLSEPPK